ncbi:MAG: ABC transporter substrate-binding protein [Lachnospiraceae bacterium]|nr:ABC transporter substrate-binding protein [Lachnospiraceae bacterium]
MKIFLKKRLMTILLCAVLAFTLSGCEGKGKIDASNATITETHQSESAEAAQTSESTPSDEAGASTEASNETPVPEEPITLRIGALKGPTTMGLLFLMEDQKNGKTKNDYEFQMATGADELLPLMVSGKLDIALLPANVAAILYQKTEGGVAVIDVNTLGVLYLVSSDDSIKSLEDLRGRTVYLTGKGTTPDCVLQYLLKAVGLEEGDVTLEYKSEASEVAAVLAQKKDAIGFLPQPFVTAACMQNDSLKIVLSAHELWQEVHNADDRALVTGVTVVRKDILESHPEAIKTFLEEHAASATAINGDPATGAKLAVEAGIVAKEPIASKAIPYCNIACVQGESMKDMLSSYLQVLFDFDKTTIGGKLPEDDFYYLGK